MRVYELAKELSIAGKDLVAKLQENGFDISFATSFLFVLFPLMLISRILDKSGHKSGCNEQESLALDKRVKFTNSLNRIFDFFMRIDEFLIRLGISLPFGGTLVVIAKKR